MADKRDTLTIKFHPEKDRDLIEWWRGLLPGNRNHTVKAALRYALELPDPQETAQADALSMIQADLAAVKQAVGRVPAIIRQTNGDSNNAQLMEIMGLVRQLSADVERLKQGNGNTADAPPDVEPAPQLENEDLDRRAKRLGKGKWG